MASGTRRAGVSTICWLARLRRGRRSNQPSQPCRSHSIRPIANHSRVRLISAEPANNPATMGHQHARPALRHLCHKRLLPQRPDSLAGLNPSAHPGALSIWCMPRCQSTPSGVPRFRAPILRDDDRHETVFALPSVWPTMPRGLAGHSTQPPTPLPPLPERHSERCLYGSTDRRRDFLYFSSFAAHNMLASRIQERICHIPDAASAGSTPAPWATDPRVEPYRRRPASLTARDPSA